LRCAAAGEESQHANEADYLYVPFAKNHLANLCTFVNSGRVGGLGEAARPMTREHGLTSSGFWTFVKSANVLWRPDEEPTYVKQRVFHWRAGVGGKDVKRDPPPPANPPYVIMRRALLDPNVAEEEAELRARIGRLEVRETRRATRRVPCAPLA